MKKHLFFVSCLLFLVIPVAQAGIADMSREAFVDVPRDAYYYQPIEKLVTMNLVIDVDALSEDEYFYPSKPLTRAEFIHWTVQLFGLGNKFSQDLTLLPATPSFSDVPKTHWAYYYVEIAKKHGLIAGTYTADGKPTGKFEPEKLLSRAEAAVILMRAFLQTPEAPEISFPDLGNVAWAKPSIQKAVSLGFFTGYPDKTFGPGNSLLRAEGITVLYKAFDKLSTNTLALKDWIKNLISKFEAKPVANPPLSITQYEYNGQVVYYVPPQCCDQSAVLYNSDGDFMCAPSGGFTGKGDGRCPDFYTEGKNAVVIWQDQRTE